MKMILRSLLILFIVKAAIFVFLSVNLLLIRFVNAQDITEATA